MKLEGGEVGEAARRLQDDVPEDEKQRRLDEVITTFRSTLTAKSQHEVSRGKRGGEESDPGCTRWVTLACAVPRMAAWRVKMTGAAQPATTLLRCKSCES